MLPSNKILRIIGFDPGYAITGYGLIERYKSKTTCLAYGCITTPKEMNQQNRLHTLLVEIKNLLNQYQPSVAGLETLLFKKNVKTAMAVAEARGVILSAIGEANLDLIELTPTSIKQSLTTYGRAEKKQVQYMVRQVLKLETTPKPDDAADALAIALATEQHYLAQY